MFECICMVVCDIWTYYPWQSIIKPIISHTIKQKMKEDELDILLCRKSIELYGLSRIYTLVFMSCHVFTSSFHVTSRFVVMLTVSINSSNSNIVLHMTTKRDVTWKRDVKTWRVYSGQVVLKPILLQEQQGMGIVLFERLAPYLIKCPFMAYMYYATLRENLLWNLIFIFDISLSVTLA